MKGFAVDICDQCEPVRNALPASGFPFTVLLVSYIPSFMSHPFASVPRGPIVVVAEL